MARLLWPAVAAACTVLAGASMVTAQHAQATAQPVYYIGTRQKAMALTFDVSWGDKMLPKVLAVLKAEHQTATFFLSGPWSRTHAELVREILAGGNELGSHGQAHVNLSDRSQAAIADNIGTADGILREYSGTALRFFRPPNGDWNGRVVETAKGLGYDTIIWSIDSRDWMNPGVNTIIRRVVSEAFPGAIILLHASDTCRQTDLALPSIIRQVRADGYRLVTLGELWSMGPAMHNDPRGSGIKPNWPPEGTPASGAGPTPGTGSPAPATTPPSPAAAAPLPAA